MPASRAAPEMEPPAVAREAFDAPGPARRHSPSMSLMVAIRRCYAPPRSSASSWPMNGMSSPGIVTKVPDTPPTRKSLQSRSPDLICQPTWHNLGWWSSIRAMAIQEFDDLLERQRDHECPGVGSQRICVRVVATAQLRPASATTRSSGSTTASSNRPSRCELRRGRPAREASLGADATRSPPSPMSPELDPPVVLITGATGPLGRVVAHRFARDGARLALVGRDHGPPRRLGEEPLRESRPVAGGARRADRCRTARDAVAGG